jgi:regulator of RNase E activity RraA
MLTDAMMLEQLRQVPASQIESAIGLLETRPRNQNVFAPGLAQLTRNARFPTTIGYAITARMGTTKNTKAADSFDWYTFVSHMSGPKVLCLSSAEAGSEEGILFGQISARILARLGVQGAIADGFVRDTVVLAEMNFPVFAQGAMLRHGAPHVVDYGQPVDIRGAHIKTGHIVAFDGDGAIAFPAELLRRIPEGLARMKARTQPVLDYLAKNASPTPAGIATAQQEGSKH